MRDGEKEMLEAAGAAVGLALEKGAAGAACVAARNREVTVTWRDGKLDKIVEATTRGLGVELYVDGRYAVMSTSDLRPEALARFVEDAVALARNLAEDKFRQLPDPALYAGQATLDLDLYDARIAEITPEQRLGRVREMEEAARAERGPAKVLSVTAEWSDVSGEMGMVTSNGFQGTRAGTNQAMSCEVSIQDPDGRRPEDSDYAFAHHGADLPAAAAIGRNAAARAYARVGAKKGASALLTLAVDARAAGRLLGSLLGPMSARALQQKRSFLDGLLDKPVGSALLEIADDPHRVRGLGSRLFDGEGLAARPMPLFAGGVLKSFFIDTYYGRKLGVAPTTGGISNLAWRLGAKDQRQLLADLGEGILVTSFLGGNSDPATGDFSHGLQGFRISKGALAEPISEMNVSGNHLQLWKQLVAVGNDPFRYSSLGTPTLVFEKLQVAGT